MNKTEQFDFNFFLELLYEVAGSYLQTGFMIGSGMKPTTDNSEALKNLIDYVKNTNITTKSN